MSDRDKSADKGRRDFLLKGIAAVGGAAALAAAGRSGAAQKPDTGTKPPAAAPESKGYRETDHIREYYNLARF